MDEINEYQLTYSPHSFSQYSPLRLRLKENSQKQNLGSSKNYVNVRVWLDSDAPEICEYAKNHEENDCEETENVIQHHLDCDTSEIVTEIHDSHEEDRENVENSFNSSDLDDAGVKRSLWALQSIR